MDPRTVAQLEQITREALDDLGTTRPRWSSAEIRRALSEAEREACARAHLLRDETTPKITQYLVPIDRSTVLLHPSIYDVVSVRRASDEQEIDQVDEQTMRIMDPRWRTSTGSQIEHYVVQVLPSERLQLRVHPIPLVADTLLLCVRRRPRDEMEADDDEPEIAPRHHDHLVQWALYRCFSKRDPDTYDPVKAADHLAAFDAVFGERESADTERDQREYGRNVVTPRSF